MPSFCQPAPLRLPLSQPPKPCKFLSLLGGRGVARDEEEFGRIAFGGKKDGAELILGRVLLVVVHSV